MTNLKTKIVAWPTFLIQLYCTFIFLIILLFSHTLHIHFALSHWQLSILLGFLFIIQNMILIKVFTPVHEGAHQHISSISWLNELFFFFLWPLFPFGPHLFRIIHLIHHSTLGQKAIDPDLYSHGKSPITTAIRCSTMIFYCLFYVIRYQLRPIHTVHSIYLRKSLGNVMVIWFYIIGQFSLIYFGLTSKYAYTFLFFWLLPSLISISITTYLNSTCPHRGCSNTTIFQSSRILLINQFLSWLLSDQNFHFVHHYRPSIPWFEYRNFWEENKMFLLNRGVQVRKYK